VTKDLEGLHLTRAAKTAGTFFLDDVSNWYLRLSRRRFWKGEMTDDKRAAFTTLHTVLESSLRLLAPFIPFTAEALFRSLAAHCDPGASVHLQEWPAGDEGLVDADLEKAMAAAQTVVGLGRSLRQDSGLKTRQPLGRLVMHANDDRADLVLADATLAGYVASELNVKDVGTVADPREVAALSAKANFRALGPRFGKQSPLAAKRITAMTGDEIMTLQRAGRVVLEFEGQDTEFTFEEVAVAEQGIGSFVAAGSQGLTVALDTTLTGDLRQEGLAREIINKVQNLRKKSGLEVSDRIELSITGSEAVLEAVEAHRERITGETLALGVASGRELAYKDSFDIDDHAIGIALDRA